MSKWGNQVLKIAADNPDVRIADEPTPQRGKTEAHRRSKYNAQPTAIDGIRFDSKAEAQRYAELKAMEQAGEISGLRLQPAYRLQEAFVDGQGRKHRPVDYIADFEYMQDGRLIAEDVKGGTATQTPIYRLKIKLAIREYPGIEFRKVTR